MSNTLIGKRLALLRTELAGPGEDAWSRTKLAVETGLTLNMVTRLEQSGAGSIETFITLLLFYHERGYNLSWVILPDNSTCSKMALHDSTKSLDAREVLSRLGILKQDVGKQIDEVMTALAV